MYTSPYYHSKQRGLDSWVEQHTQSHRHRAEPAMGHIHATVSKCLPGFSELTCGLSAVRNNLGTTASVTSFKTKKKLQFQEKSQSKISTRSVTRFGTPMMPVSIPSPKSERPQVTGAHRCALPASLSSGMDALAVLMYDILGS